MVDANANLAKTLQEISTQNITKDDLSRVISSLDISIKALGKIKTTFENLRILWTGVQIHCQSLSDVSLLKELDFDKELVREEIMNLGFGWMALG